MPTVCLGCCKLAADTAACVALASGAAPAAPSGPPGSPRHTRRCGSGRQARHWAPRTGWRAQAGCCWAGESHRGACSGSTARPDVLQGCSMVMGNATIAAPADLAACVRPWGDRNFSSSSSTRERSILALGIVPPILASCGRVGKGTPLAPRAHPAPQHRPAVCPRLGPSQDRDSGSAARQVAGSRPCGPVTGPAGVPGLQGRSMLVLVRA